MSGVRSQLLPLHGELSTRSLAPAASTAGWFASIASAGSFEPLGRYGVVGLPTVTLLSADTAPAVSGNATVAVSATKGTRRVTRRVIIDSFSLQARSRRYSRTQDGAIVCGSPIRDPLTSAGDGRTMASGAGDSGAMGGRL